MKKIGILAFTKRENGGVFQYTQSIIDALKLDDKNKYIIFTNEDNKDLQYHNFEIRYIEKPKETFFIKLTRLIQTLFFIRKPYFFTKKELDSFRDIDEFISPGIMTYPHFYLNKSFIFTLHDLQEKYFPDFFTFKTRIKRFTDNRALTKTARTILCESEFVKNDIVKFTKTNTSKIIIIQSPPPENFLNYSFNNEQFLKVQAKYSLPEKFIFYPAQCWFHKNHIKLVEAFEIVSKKYHDVYLILTGSQQNNYNNLMARIDELNLNDKVKHLGYIDYEDLPYFYKMSEFLIMPTLFESVSIPIYEAFALEVAVCSSNVVALPEQVGDAGLTFNPHDINDIAEKMLIYLNNNDLRESKAKKGFRKIVNFDHEIYYKKLSDLLK